MRIQGPLVETQEATAEKVRGRRSEAIVQIAEYLRTVCADPHSGLSGLWRWIYGDSIWLYHHHETQKWKCLFFRIRVDRFDTNLNFWLESYVPFGFGNDPAAYEMQSSNVFVRPDWNVTAVASMSYNQARTYSVGISQSHTAGVSYGQNLSVNAGANWSESVSTTTGTSRSGQSGWNQAQSWFENWGDSSGHGSTGMGGFSQNSQSSRGSGRGSSYGLSFSETDTESESESSSSTTGGSVGVSRGVQSGHNRAVTEGVNQGLAHSNGESLQYGVWAYGIDYAKNPKQHLANWMSSPANGDAAHMYRTVQKGFLLMASQVTEKLIALGSGRGRSADEEIDARPELRSLILMDEPSLRMEVAPGGGPAKTLDQRIERPK